jgi:ATP-dependent helicase/nuclease subunit A
MRQRGDKWYYTVEYTDDSGTHHKCERPGGLSKTECRKAWREAMAEIDSKGKLYVTVDKNVQSYLEEWILECVEILPKYNTIKSYKSIVNIHIIPTIGAKPLKKINARILQNLLNEKSKTLSKSTVRSICAVLKLAFSYATDFCEYIRTDPAAKIRVPKYIDAPKETEVFSPSQLNILINKFPPGHQFYMPIETSYHTGLRECECFANGWDQVDMQERIYKVRFTVIDVGGKPTIQELPKSKSSRRDVPFGDKFYKILKAEKARQAAFRLQYGPHYQQNNLVCCWPNGSLMGPNDIRFFNMFCKDTFGSGSFQSFRHTHATMLLEAGEDLEIVSKRLGHSSIYITAMTYSHVLEKRKAKSVALIDKVL